MTIKAIHLCLWIESLRYLYIVKISFQISSEIDKNISD